MVSSAAKPRETTQQEICIDLPGEAVQCWRSSDNIRVKLRKHRDVFFDLNLKKGATYTIESASDFYSSRDKKLLRKVDFQDGERFNVWVGRDFRGNLVLKEKGRIMGSYQVNQLDTKNYGTDPKIKPEPLMVIMGQRNLLASFAHTDTDPFGIGSTQQLFKPSFDPNLSFLKNHGTEFDYCYPPEPPEITEYVAVTEAMSDEIQPQVLKQLESGKSVEGKVDQIFVAPKQNQPPSALYTALSVAARNISGNEFLTGNIFKEGSGYIQENFRSLNKIFMTVRIEKKPKGKYIAALKGRPITKWIGQAFGATQDARIIHEKIPLGSTKSAFIDGGYGKNGKTGYGSVKRIMLTSAVNFRSGLKIQIIGTVIDLIVDVNAVYFDENGSKDLSEFLGRAGVSIAKAGATAAIGSVFAAAGISFVTGAAIVFGAGVAPVIAVVAVVIGGYIVAATIVDIVDEKFNLKTGVAKLAK